jgi:hypothetical protein
MSKAAQGSHLLLVVAAAYGGSCCTCPPAHVQQALPHAGMQALLMHPRYRLVLSGCLL